MVLESVSLISRRKNYFILPLGYVPDPQKGKKRRPKGEEKLVILIANDWLEVTLYAEI